MERFISQYMLRFGLHLPAEIGSKMALKNKNWTEKEIDLIWSKNKNATIICCKNWCKLNYDYDMNMAHLLCANILVYCYFQYGPLHFRVCHWNDALYTKIQVISVWETMLQTSTTAGQHCLHLESKINHSLRSLPLSQLKSHLSTIQCKNTIYTLMNIN